MKRPRANALDPVELHITTTQAISDLIDQLLATGLYGRCRSEVAERLLAEKLRQLCPPVRLR